VTGYAGRAGNGPLTTFPRPKGGTVRVLAPHIHQHRGVYHGWRRGHLRDPAQIGRYLIEACHLAGLTPIGDPVVSEAHKFGLGGWLHLTTSGFEFMGWHEPDGWEYLTIDWYTCGPPPGWPRLVAHADQFFSIDPADRDFQPVLTELAGVSALR
jgi:hypothetical protein